MILAVTAETVTRRCSGCGDDHVYPLAAMQPVPDREDGTPGLGWWLPAAADCPAGTSEQIFPLQGPPETEYAARVAVLVAQWTAAHAPGIDA